MNFRLPPRSHVPGFRSFGIRNEVVGLNKKTAAGQKVPAAVHLLLDTLRLQ